MTSWETELWQYVIIWGTMAFFVIGSTAIAYFTATDIYDRLKGRNKKNE